MATVILCDRCEERIPEGEVLKVQVDDDNVANSRKVFELCRKCYRVVKQALMPPDRPKP